MKLLDRYVVRGMLGPFLAGLCVFTVFILAFDPLKRAAQMLMDGTGTPATALYFVLASVPAPLAYAFPMSTLLACLLTFGRLSSDSEIVAMKAGGISMYRIALPGLALSLLLATIALYLANTVVPEANYQSRTYIIRQLPGEQDMIVGDFGFKEVANDGTERILSARQFDLRRDTLEGVAISFYRNGSLVRQLNAPKAEHRTEGWMLSKVTGYDMNEAGKPMPFEFAELALPMAQGPDTRNRPRGRDELTREMLLRKVQIEMATHEGKVTNKVNSYLVDYHLRVALPMSCLVFGLFGVPLGLQPQRTTKSIGIGLSILFILIYYLLMTFSRAFGESGLLTPVVAAWLPNAVFAGVGLWLLVKAGRV